MKKHSSGVSSVSPGRIQKGAPIPSDKGKMIPVNTTSRKMYSENCTTGDGVRKNLGKGHK